MQKRIFPEVLRKWLGDRSVRQGAIALGVVENTLHAWLSGKALPPSLRIVPLAKALGVQEWRLRKAIKLDRETRESESGAHATLSDEPATNGTVP